MCACSAHKQCFEKVAQNVTCITAERVTLNTISHFESCQTVVIACSAVSGCVCEFVFFHYLDSLMNSTCVPNLTKMTTVVNVAHRLLVSTRSLLVKNTRTVESFLVFTSNFSPRSTRKLSNFAVNPRFISTSTVSSGSAARAETTSTIQGLSKLQAEELVLRLTSEERSILSNALHEYQSKLVKDEYEGKTT